MKFDYYEYKISEHWMSALINGDYTGLDDSEENTLDAWLAGLPVHGHWDISQDELDNGPAFSVCDICQLHAMCYAIRHYFPTREAEECAL